MGYTIGQELFRIILNKLLSGPLGKENPFFKILLKKGIGQLLTHQGVFKKTNGHCRRVNVSRGRNLYQGS